MTKQHGSGLSATLATATCTLLGTAAANAVLAEEADDWDFDTALLYYGESDGRVQDASLNVLANRQFTDDRSLSLGLTVDALTGATPNGAIRIGEAQTFTRPSGNAAYDIAPGGLPLDDTFLDTRYALTAGWKQPLGRLNTFGVGVSASSEYDYTHAGFNTQFARDFNDRNTTLSAALAIARDEIDPVGGTPLELSPMLDVGDLSNRRGAESKEVVDVVFGLTQVISRNTLVQVNYSWSDASGYLTDPYKVLSVVDPETGVTLPRAVTPEVVGPSHAFLYEGRPEERSKQSLYGQVRHYMNGKVLDVSYRYMTDDWDIDSHTVDTHLRWPVGTASYLEPHLRFYAQTEASFYSPSLPAGIPIPAFASSDYRLGRFQALTAGVKYGWRMRGDHEMSVRLEWYQQRGDVPADMLVGGQSAADVYPDLDAVIAQFSYRF
ncbi:MAG TPA: DUF3570 domain-containing protein [Woeseiaceae bacterium]|nr:DUF3570 domain-containing protein [Woeseiaceae bacterium]